MGCRPAGRLYAPLGLPYADPARPRPVGELRLTCCRPPPAAAASCVPGKDSPAPATGAGTGVGATSQAAAAMLGGWPFEAG